VLFRDDPDSGKSIFEEQAMSTMEKSHIKNAPLDVPDDQSDFVSWATSVSNGSIAAGWQPRHPHSAGGLAASISADPRRQSLGKLVELSRRRMRLSVEQLAQTANVDLAELLAIEKAEEILPEPRTIYQLAQVLRMRVEPLLELAGLAVSTSGGLTESAVRFAARSEPMDSLTSEEEAALSWFVQELSK
jgi:DNA-binding XRE family transcriptional regulator